MLLASFKIWQCAFGHVLIHISKTREKLTLYIYGDVNIGTEVKLTSFVFLTVSIFSLSDIKSYSF